jgi:hypothetical protein
MWQQLCFGDYQCGLGVVQHVPQLFPSASCVYRNSNGTYPGAAKDQVQQLSPVRGHQRHRLSALDAGTAQHATSAGSSLDHGLAVAAVITAAKQGGRGSIPGTLEKHLRDGQWTSTPFSECRIHG